LGAGGGVGEGRRRYVRGRPRLWLEQQPSVVGHGRLRRPLCVGGTWFVLAVLGRPCLPLVGGHDGADCPQQRTAQCDDNDLRHDHGPRCASSLGGTGAAAGGYGWPVDTPEAG